MDNQLKQYARMQKAYYDNTSQEVEELVGNHDYHENFPYYPYCRTAPPPASEAFLTDIHHIDRLHARWFENRYDAAGTNSYCDVAFGTHDIPHVLEDFRRWFHQADVWFTHMAFFHLRGPRT